jgi:hypothetical protein
VENRLFISRQRSALPNDDHLDDAFVAATQVMAFVQRTLIRKPFGADGGAVWDGPSAIVIVSGLSG